MRKIKIEHSQMHIESFIKSIFLLILAINGNYVAETLNCSLQKYLTDNMYAKHFVNLLIIYFTLGFVGNDKINPTHNFMFTLGIYIVFLLFTKMDLNFSILAFIVLAVIYTLNNYLKYYEDQKDPDEKLNNKIRKAIYNLCIGLIILILIGSIIYTRRQLKEHKDWSTMKFIFGVTKCKSLN
jgi:hypothetical protein